MTARQLDNDLQEAAKPNAQNRRKAKRLSFYRGEFPDVQIVFANKSYGADVYDVSRQGMGILPQEPINGLTDVPQDIEIKIGDKITKHATIQSISHIKFSGTIRAKFGIQFKPDTNVTELEPNYSCEDTMPLAYCADPVAYGQTLLFNITHFSRSGLTIRISDYESPFYNGLVLDLHILMPVRGEIAGKASIESITDSTEGLSLHCKWIQPPKALLNAVSEFLLMNSSNLSIANLRSQGFTVSSVEKSFRFRCASTEEEFEKILKLRLKAATASGRWVGEKDHRKMEDPWDKHARQVYFEVNEKVVAASRIVFNNGIQERCEHEASYGVKVPDWLWKEGFVEGSRMCTDPEFRGSEVFLNLIRQVSRIITQSGHRYLVMNCEDSLLPIYKKATGIQNLGTKFHTDFMKNDALNLLYIDVRKIQVATNLSPTTWLVGVPVGDHLVQNGSIKLSWWEQTMRFIYRPAHKLMSYVFKLR